MSARLTGWKLAAGQNADRRSGRGIGSSGAGHYPLGKMVEPDRPNPLDEKYVVPAKFLQKYADKLDRRLKADVSSAQALGSGTHGTAFDIGGGRVLKVTNDKSEANASMTILGKSARHVANVYDVFAFPDGMHYGIVVEKLEPLSEGEKEELIKALKRMNWASMIGKADLSGGAYIASVGGKSWSQFREEAIDDSIEGRQEVMEYTLDDLENFKIDMMADELVALGIKFHDYHPGNVMKRGGEYVVIDLGASKSPQQQIPMLETKRLREDDHPDDADSFLEKTVDVNAALLAKRGIDVSSKKRLGAGANGIAFDIGAGRVMKVTYDESEARSSFVLKGADTKHVVRIYDVFRFPWRDDGGGLYSSGDNVFGIIEEKLQKLSYKEARDLEDVIRKVTWAGRDYVSPGSHAFEEELGKRVGPDNFNLAEMLEELKKNGVTQFRDWHSGNIMKRGSDYVVIDLGYSQSDGPLPPVLEVGALFGSKAGKEDENQKVRAQNSWDILKTNHQKLSRRGIDLHGSSVIGMGFMGVAFDVGGGRVLKVTSDRKEAQASFKIMGKTLKNVVQIYDVFSFPAPDDEIYGILQEKLSPLEATEKRFLDEVVKWTDIRTSLWRNGFDWDRAVADSLARSDPKDAKRIEMGLAVLEDRFGIKSIIDELQSHGIGYADFHGGNIMKRGDEYVVIDLGVSNVKGGVDPPVLERMSEALEPKTVALAYGRFQPFHAGRAQFVRELANKFSKVVLVLTNERRPDAPFSYDLTVETMMASLPDVANKVEIHRAERDGQRSAFLPGIVSDIVREGNSSIDEKTAVNVVVQPELADRVAAQFEMAPEDDELAIDPSLYVVERSDMVVGKRKGEISPEKFIAAASSGDRDALGGLMDPHIMSTPGELDRLAERMREELEEFRGRMAEGLFSGTAPTAIANNDRATASDNDGGKRAIPGTLELNAEALRTKKGIDVSSLQELGQGEKGIAYDIGGGRVMKVTTDESEALSSNSVRGKNLEHVVDVYDVWRFGRATGEQELYGIVMEKLTPMSAEEQREFDSAVEYVRGNDALLDVLALKSWDEFRKTLWDAVKKDVAQEISNPAKLKQVVTKKYTHVMSMMERFSVPQMKADLDSAGVKFADYHRGNVMKKGDKYVILDLGMSESNGPAPEVFESIVRAMVAEAVVEGLGTGGVVGGGLGSFQVGVRAQTSPWSNGNRALVPQDDDEDDIDEDAAAHEGSMIALYPPKEFAEILALAGGELPDDLHVTLACFGDGLLDEERDIVDKIAAEIASKIAPISAKLGGIGRFSASDSSDGKDVVYLSIDSPVVDAVRDAIVDGLADAGVALDSVHGFTPHMTLAYISSDSSMPVKRVVPIDIVFDAITVAHGGTRAEFPIANFANASETGI